MFELNKQGEYTVKLSEPIEDFDKDQYGNQWHNVLFEGDAETYMWLAKNPPEEGKTYWGHIEKTKSGKRLRFKTDQKPDDAPKSSSNTGQPKAKSDAYLKDISNTPIMIYNGSLHYAKDLGLNLISNPEDRSLYLEYVKEITDEMILWIENIRGGSQESGVHPPAQPIKAEKLAPATSLGDQFRNRNQTNQVTSEFSDRDIPEDM